MVLLVLFGFVGIVNLVKVTCKAQSELKIIFLTYVLVRLLVKFRFGIKDQVFTCVLEVYL